jgi:hypothetical protein
MVKYCSIIPVLLVLIVSCTGFIPGTIAEKPQIPSYIMGQGRVSSEKMAVFLLRNNPDASAAFARLLASFYIEEAALEGINHDVAFSQMCVETGFLAYGGLVTPDMYNFCGLGSTGLPGADGQPEKGLRFSDPRTGVRAHIQHLKAYATSEPLKMPLVDPRYRFVRSGSSPTIDGLAGTWASDRQYAEKIKSIIERLYELIS